MSKPESKRRNLLPYIIDYNEELSLAKAQL
jgi:hypothetical protein